MNAYTDAKLSYMVRRAAFCEWKILPRYIRNYELVLVLRGYGEIAVEDERFTAEAGDLLFFRPGVKHSLWVEKEPYMEFYGMHFELPPGAETVSFPSRMHVAAPHRLTSLFRSLYEVYRQKGYLCEWQQELLLQQVLCEISILLHAEKEPITSVRIRKVLAYIQEDPCRPLSMEELLRQAGIRKTLFINSFRQVTGTTPVQYIIGQRLEYAQDLLLETDLSVAQIAERCGFSDPFYFSRCFRKRFLFSPRQYREKNRGDGAGNAPLLL